MKVKSRLETMSQPIMDNSVDVKKKVNPYNDSIAYKKFLSDIQKLRKRFGPLCLHPNKSDCVHQMIDAHTISKSNVLRLIAKNGNVLMPTVLEFGGEFTVQKYGINKATAFPCFCHEHDKMFYPIDGGNAEITDENTFLYAYRAFAASYYKLLREMNCCSRISEQYNLESNPLSLVLGAFLQHNKNILDTYKQQFDQAILANEIDILETSSMVLGYRTAIAASTCLSLEFDLYGNRIKKDGHNLPVVFISIIPQLDRTNIIFSWFKQDREIFLKLKNQFAEYPHRYIMTALNNLIPLDCENMVLSPVLWDAWNDEARQEFTSTISEHLEQIFIKNLPQDYVTKRKYNIFQKISW